MEREHARAGRDFGDCLVEPFNLPGEDTKGHRAVATCSGPTSKGLAQLEPNPGFLDPQAWDLSTSWNCLTGCHLIPQVPTRGSTLVPKQSPLITLICLFCLQSSTVLALPTLPCPNTVGVDQLAQSIKVWCFRSQLFQTLLFYIWKNRGSDQTGDLPRQRS